MSFKTFPSQRPFNKLHKSLRVHLLQNLPGWCVKLDQFLLVARDTSGGQKPRYWWYLEGSNPPIDVPSIYRGKVCTNRHNNTVRNYYIYFKTQYLFLCPLWTLNRLKRFSRYFLISRRYSQILLRLCGPGKNGVVVSTT